MSSASILGIMAGQCGTLQSQISDVTVLDSILGSTEKIPRSFFVFCGSEENPG